LVALASVLAGEARDYMLPATGLTVLTTLVVVGIAVLVDRLLSRR
jgi:hypothetical protein